jgi:hypothetical protein
VGTVSVGVRPWWTCWRTAATAPTNWASPQSLTLTAPTDPDTAHALVTITARIDAATATQSVVEVVDTTMVAIGWPEASTAFSYVTMPTIDLYEVAIDAPLAVRHLQVTANAGNIMLGVYGDAGGRPDVLLASAYGWSGSLGSPTTAFLDEPTVLTPGIYWLAVSSSQFGTWFANAQDSAVTAHCRTAGGGLPPSLAGTALTCDVAPPIAIAALGRTE